MKKTVPEILDHKGKIPLVVMTAYDYAGGLQCESAGVDIILVGDSLGMTVLGYDSTMQVTVADMIHHTKAVRRGAPSSFIVVDMPFGSFQTGTPDALRAAVRLIKETGADAVKLEGGTAVLEIVQHLTQHNIPVMGHVGLTPQTATALGGFKVQGKDETSAKMILEGAKALEQAGAFSVVLEAIPHKLGRLISESLNIPTIGIGAGNACDGQVLVYHDVLGIYDRFKPKFVKQYAELGRLSVEALVQFAEEVRSSAFPTLEHSFSMSDDVLKRLY
jgi:3-methyl-2-oxobutanoate hydroxymethyltransferase